MVQCTTYAFCSSVHNWLLYVVERLLEERGVVRKLFMRCLYIRKKVYPMLETETARFQKLGKLAFGCR